jgi:hypothetical protein
VIFEGWIKEQKQKHRLWDVADLVALWEAYEQRRVERAA